MTELWDVVDRVNERVEEGGTVFWKRQHFNRAGNYSTEPHWHRVAKIERGKDDVPVVNSYRWNFTWTALCGYSYTFEGLLGKKPDVRHDVKTRKLRCAKCDAAAAKLG